MEVFRRLVPEDDPAAATEYIVVGSNNAGALAPVVAELAGR